MHYISILSTIVTFIFTAAVFNRYRYKGGKHLLFWGLGLALYGIGTLTEAVLAFTFSPLALRLWYLAGAMLTAAWLGQGTINLLVRRRGVAPVLNWVLIAVSAVALVLVLAAPVTSAASTYSVNDPVSAQYKTILTRSVGIVVLTILLNIYGTIGLIGGALYSSYLFWRKRVLGNRVIGNILIAAGALMPAMAGSLIKAGLADWLYVSELLGVVLMFVGFLQATAPQTVKADEPAAAATD